MKSSAISWSDSISPVEANSTRLPLHGPFRSIRESSVIRLPPSDDDAIFGTDLQQRFDSELVQRADIGACAVRFAIGNMIPVVWNQQIGGGGRGWNRTIDPSRVKRVLYR